MPDLLGLRGVAGEQILAWIRHARAMQEILQRPVAKVPALRGRRIALMFFENSTRTRMSFELAAKSLGADVLNFSASGSSLAKGETILDTAKTISALGADCMVVRDGHSQMPAYLSQHLEEPVINAGDGTNEHPTQALLDLCVLAQLWQGRFEDRLLVIVGDVARSRVARSHLWAAHALGHRVRLVGPRQFFEPGLVEAFGCELTSDLDAGLRGADAVMALRVQKERRQQGGPWLSSQLDYFRTYGLTRARLQQRGEAVPLLHPGPVNRAMELAPDLLYDADRSQIQTQVQTGVALRMAVLYWALGGSDEQIVERVHAGT